MKVAKKMKKEIEKAILLGDNPSGQRYLVISPDNSYKIMWADDNRQWHPWNAEDKVTGIPALFPEGSGLEYEMAQDCLDDRIGQKGRKEIEDRLYEIDGSLIEYANAHYGDWMKEAILNETEYKLDEFLAEL